MSVFIFCRHNVSASGVKPYTSIIHVMWSTSVVPLRWRRSALSWVRKNDNFVYCHWTDAELDAFVADQFPWLLSTYLAYPYVIQRSDAARYLLLYHYGGIYVDLDVLCLKPLSLIIAKAPVDASVIVAPTQPFGVTIEFIVVRTARDPVIAGVISGLRRAAISWWYPPLPYTTVMFRTGPVYFSRRLDCHVDKRRLFIMPLSKYMKDFVGHVGGSSWHSWDGRLFWRIFLLLERLFRHTVLLIVLSTAFLLCICLIRCRHLIGRPGTMT